MTGLNRDQVVEILRLVRSEDLICKRKGFILDTFIKSQIIKSGTTVQCTTAYHKHDCQLCIHYSESEDKIFLPTPKS